MIFKAWADDRRLITCVIAKNYYENEAQAFYVGENSLRIIDKQIKEDSIVYKCETDFDIDPDYEYKVKEIHNLSCDLRYRFIVKSEYFNEKYKYEGKLGSFYTPEKTEFYLWAPTSQEAYVELLIENKPLLVTMIKNKGVFSCTVYSDLNQIKYRYLTKCGGKHREFSDPYADGLSQSDDYSIVVDTNRYSEVSSFKNTDDPIIYEISVRDFTSDPNTTIKNKGKYLGVIEEATTNENTSCGLNYLKELQISHVQIMPVTKCGTLDDNNPDKHYNWGYDPICFSVVEGSYSTNPNNPYCRIDELREMVDVLHKNNIGVIYDIVINHVYNPIYHSLNKAVPYYYYRYYSDGTMSNGSGCGNDLDSELPMVRHLLKNFLDVFIRRFKADGFRFDLMGLIDQDTIKYLTEYSKSLKEDILLYGEGWNMQTSLEEGKRSAIINDNKDMKVGYFNDYFRDSLKGSTYHPNGFLTNDLSLVKNMINCLSGTAFNDNYQYHFDDVKKSINYIECHDNKTLYDLVFPIEEKKRNLIIKSCLACLLLSLGTPFIHSGLEFKRTKYGYDNTYNLNDKINHLDWSLKDENKDLVEFTKQLISLRKRLNLYNLKPEEIRARYHFDILYETDIKVRIDTKGLNEFQELYLIINARDDSWFEEMYEEYVLLLDAEGIKNEKLTRAFVNQHSVVLLGKY